MEGKLHTLDQVLSIEILGQPFTFKTDADIAEAKTVADFLVKSVHQATQQCASETKNPDKRAILILTALNITNEFFDLQKKHEKLLNDINRRSGNLLHALESQLARKQIRNARI
jgi:cell division protein ZapA (FtsZ GTPase activity inhibitor)